MEMKRKSHETKKQKNKGHVVNRERRQKGKKCKGLFEGMDGNNGERKKSKVQPESQCITMEADIQPRRAQ